MNTIAAIETVYRGFRFRSRLEARWAVFFDAMGIAWEYELEGFTLSDGSRYLPDFHLPRFCGGLWVEVKPEQGDFSKALQFASDAHEPILCALGVPDLRVYTVFEDIGAVSAAFCDEYIFGGHAAEHRLFWSSEEPPCAADNPKTLEAVNKARSARFER